MQIFANKKIEEYANEMPLELRRVVDALNDKLRLAIFFVLLKYGELSFSQIMNELEIPRKYSSRLTYHLKKLEKSALIKNEYAKKEGAESYSFYDLTEFAEELLNGLMHTIAVPEPIKNAATIETKPIDSDKNQYIYKEFYTHQPKFYSENIEDLLVNDVKERILEQSSLNKKMNPYNFGLPQDNIININIGTIYMKERKEYPKKVIVDHKNIEIYARC